MGLKETSKKLLSGATVALATTGLSSCAGCGAVDPPPPPLQCTTDLQDGTFLNATATLEGSTLAVVLDPYSYVPGQWQTLDLTNLVNATVVSVNAQSDATVVIVLDLAPSATTGSFRFMGELSGSTGTCSVARTYTFELLPSDGGAAGQVLISAAGSLPLEAREQATIAMVRRDGNEVEVEARSRFAGPRTLSWEVSGGEIVSAEGSRMRWRLPAEPGLHQVEVLMDYGVHGFAFDALAIEST